MLLKFFWIYLFAEVAIQFSTIGCGAFTVPDLPLARNADGEIGPRPSLKFTCIREDGTPMDGLVPSLYNCHQFYVCHLKDHTSNITEPTLFNCAEGHGDTTVYDFKGCACGHKEDTVCYNDALREHRREFFACTVPFEMSPEVTTSLPEMNQYSSN